MSLCSYCKLKAVACLANKILGNTLSLNVGDNAVTTIGNIRKTHRAIKFTVSSLRSKNKQRKQDTAVGLNQKSMVANKKEQSHSP